MTTLPFSTVSSEDQLNQDLAAIAGTSGSYTITFSASITLGSDLLAINLGTGGSLSIDGAGFTLDGGGSQRGLFAYAGGLTVSDLTIANAVATGGRGGEGSGDGGGGGGGGAGLGGGLFVGAKAAVTLSNVSFSNNSALGGAGGDALVGSRLAGGGGGGMGGAGGVGQQKPTSGGGGFYYYAGSGGGVGTTAHGGSPTGSAGGPGIIPTGPTTTTGGGGGTGKPSATYSAAGGGVSPAGAAGGFGGGGAGAAAGNSNGNGTPGGAGGFGGGGGGAGGTETATSGGAGGFGGGGGGDTSVNLGGFGAGAGGVGYESHNSKFYPGGGGGGLGAGADIFVEQGGQITLAGTVELNAGTVKGGAGGGTAQLSQGSTRAAAGDAFGNGIFLQGTGAVAFAPPTGGVTTVSSQIADMKGSVASSDGAGSVVMDGAGVLKLAVAETYTGGTTIKSGTLELGDAGAAGTGAIIFGGPSTLQIDTAAMPTNTITGLGTDDTIDLAALKFVSGATAVIANDKLTVKSGTTTVTLNVDAADATLQAQADAGGGTKLSLPVPTVDNEAELNAALLAIAGRNAANTINIGASFTLDSDLAAINLGPNGTLTINGNDFAIDGNKAWRGLTAYSGSVTINDLRLQDMVAQGGKGGDGATPGGGGGGLGAGLLVAAGAAVTLNGVVFADNQAIGGAGGNYRDLLLYGYGSGGGGGLGGDGGEGTRDADGGGGGFGTKATGGTSTTSSGQGAGGLVVGGASAGSGLSSSGTVAGGIDGGGGGDGPAGGGGGGGVGGQNAFVDTAGSNVGGNGGWGGGGGGGGGGPAGVGFNSDGGGSGGFGGGAGGYANGNEGGFGGGGAGGGATAAAPGWGGGEGGNSTLYNAGAGGGAGLGADILIQQGGTVIIGSGDLGVGTVQGGAGGSGENANIAGSAGGADGSSLFLQGNQTLTLAPASAQLLTIRGVISDQDGSKTIAGGGGKGAIDVNGAGTVQFLAANSYSGGTTIDAGTLELAVEGGAGSGAITFGLPTATAVLKLDYVDPSDGGVTQQILSLGGLNSHIYLPHVAATNVKFGAYDGTNLTFSANGVQYHFSDLAVEDTYHLTAASLTEDASGSGLDITALQESAPCFAAGTRLRTASGETAVEDIAAGDLVLVRTRTGDALWPVRWTGRRAIDCALHPKPILVWPVRVRAGAFGPRLPRVDLWLSPDHCIYLNGVMIPVKELINDITIEQIPVDEVTYYHVEFESHAVVLAEALEVESYLDTDGRANFANGGGVMRLFPDFATLSDDAAFLWESLAYAPRQIVGPEIDAARDLLAKRAALVKPRQRGPRRRST